MWAGEKNRSPLHQYSVRLRLQNIVLRDPAASVRNAKSCIPASPEALFDSSHPLPTATAGNTFVLPAG